MTDIVRKARSGTRNYAVDINLSHMNPLKCLKSYKKSFDCKQRRTTEKLTSIEHMVNKQLKLVEFSPVPLEQLTDEAVLQIAR